jgi:hypothetical protein
MRSSTLLVAVMLVGCGFGTNKQSADAGPDPMIDASGGGDDGGGGDIDAAVDGPSPDSGPAGCQPTKLLTGGMDPAAQGWAVVMDGPAALSSGPDYTKLVTTTPGSATTGGRLLLTHAVTIEPSKPFKLQIEMMVEQTDAHDPFDCPSAILGSFTAPGGTVAERNQMLCLDPDQISWGDNTDDSTVAVVNNAYHTYLVAVDAAGNAAISVDGTEHLMWMGYALSGTIAIGDQTTNPKRDSTLRIRSITLPCI